MTPPDDAALRARALRWLSQREYSRQELGGRLSRWIKSCVGSGVAPDADERFADPASTDAVPDGPGAAAVGSDRIQRLLDRLAAEGWLSQARFIESRVHARHARFGNLRIAHELRQHGLAAPDDLAQSLRDSEPERARRAWERRFGVPPANLGERVRQMRFLTARGFSSETIHRLLDDLAARPRAGPDGGDQDARAAKSGC